MDEIKMFMDETMKELRKIPSFVRCQIIVSLMERLEEEITIAKSEADDVFSRYMANIHKPDPNSKLN